MSDTPSYEELVNENRRLAAETSKQQALLEFFRDSVGECHVMISREADEFQIRHLWDSTDLPPRVLKLLQTTHHLQKAESQREAYEKANKELHDAYMRVRGLLDAWETKTGGTDRFEVVERKIIELKDKVTHLERLRNEHVRQISILEGTATTRLDVSSLSVDDLRSELIRARSDNADAVSWILRLRTEVDQLKGRR